VSWFDAVNPGELVLCRLARLGTLRLLTNVQVMGPDALQPGEAWKAVGKLEQDERVVLLAEPANLDASLENLIASCLAGPNLWTDAYLAAFAITASLQMVSFDRGFSKFAGLDLQLLRV
jgi:toxin-antitoxin system PIN domain toxin